MTVTCMVFIDRSMSGTNYTFVDVPRVGDSIQLGTDGPDWMLTVDSVTFVAKGVYGDREPGIQINASKHSTR